jgi:hypothetical protein
MIPLPELAATAAAAATARRMAGSQKEATGSPAPQHKLLNQKQQQVMKSWGL